MRLWMQKDRVAYAEACLTKGEMRRMQDAGRDMFCAIAQSLRRAAAWKRALKAYKACKNLADEPNEPLLTP